MKLSSFDVKILTGDDRVQAIENMCYEPGEAENVKNVYSVPSEDYVELIFIETKDGFFDTVVERDSIHTKDVAELDAFLCRNGGTTRTVDTLARAFLKEITSWFAEDGVTATFELVENANDHFDANMSMDAAFRACGLDPFEGADGGMTQANTDLFNNAWSRAVTIAKGE